MPTSYIVQLMRKLASEHINPTYARSMEWAAEHIERQADAIRVLREAMDDLLTDYERHTDSSYCELSTEDTLIDASNNAIAQTKEFVE